MQPLLDRIKGQKSILITIIILGLALVQGLIFLFLMPPWQHYDEPGNFEYAWLTANLDHWPQNGEYDVEMRREVVASMIEHNFYREISTLPDLLATNPPANIGYSQLSDVPLYFFLASLPLRVFKYNDITFQLYASRFISLILYLITIWISIGICRDLFGNEHALSWMVPSFLVLLPPFTDMMTAVNNDVAAIAFSSLFLWGSIRILLRGLNPWRFIWIVAALVACLLSKITAMIALPIFFIVISIGIYKLIHRQILVYVMALMGIIIILIMFSWNSSSPMFFYARRETLLPERLKSNKSPVGEYILGLPAQKSSGDGYYQMLPANDITLLAGKIVTLGVWMWADQPVDIRFPSIIIDNIEVRFQNNIHLEAEPHFYSYAAQFPDTGSHSWLAVYPAVSNNRIQTYWDGWVLVEGDFSASNPPVFLGEQAALGNWSGKNFTNIIRNASGEKLWPKFISPINESLNKYFNITSSYVWSILDIKGTGWYYQNTINWIFLTFWTKFGWAHISLRGERFYWIFSLLCITGIVGSMLALWYYRKKLPWSVILIFAIDLFGTLWITLLKGVGSWFFRLLIPAARYAYPAIIPFAIILCGGWFFLFDRYIRRMGVSRVVGFVCYVGGLVIYDILALISITSYYGR
jgi:hypothetical protein